jgi:hypothetical protein
MADIKCPNCSRDFVRRVSRVSLGEKLLSLFYIYPFKCQLCGERFRAVQRGVRYVRVEEDRREYDRMEMRFPISFSAPEISGEGVILNFSMGGCSFSTAAAVPIGTILKLQLQVSSTIAPVTIEAALVRNVGAGRVGVEFLRWQASERERLQLFVRGMLIGRQNTPA